MEKPSPLRVFDYQQIVKYMESKGIYMDTHNHNFGEWTSQSNTDFHGQDQVLHMHVVESTLNTFYNEGEVPDWVLNIIRELEKEFKDDANKEGKIKIQYWW